MNSRIHSEAESNEREAQREYNESVDSIVENRVNTVTNDSNTVYDLLAGYIDSDGGVHKTFTIREMNGTDEEYINRSDIKSNGAKVATALLTRCVTSVGSLTKKDMKNPKDWENIFKNMLTGDRDKIILEIRRQSIGETIETAHVCPNPECKAKLKTEVSLDELEINEFNGMREIPFVLPKGYTDKKGELHREGMMRRPNGLDSELLTPMAKNNIAKAETLLLTRLCRFDDGTYVDESVMASLSIKDRQYLQKLLAENQFGIEMSVYVTCTQCGEEFKGSLNSTNFI